jgi:hypothetical protein
VRASRVFKRDVDAVCVAVDSSHGADHAGRCNVLGRVIEGAGASDADEQASTTPDHVDCRIHVIESAAIEHVAKHSLAAST